MRSLACKMRTHRWCSVSVWFHDCRCRCHSGRWLTPEEIASVGHAFTSGIRIALGEDRPRLRAPAEIRQYCNDPRWHIVTSAPIKDPRLIFDWTSCPGTLHEDFDTARQAAVVAAWWGYEPMLTEPCPSHRIRSRSAPRS